MDATYSPEDNKLRLYAEGRLDDELYQRVRAAGFRWAPKQDLFVAPMWTPGRADLMIELCDEIGDEDTSLVDRAEDRADRFEGYSDRRAADAESSRAAVDAIVDGIPFGQPILVGHHSEKRARKDAERIDNGMRRSIKMWDTSKYWTRRAAGALAAAKYKELPAVRARRIKKLEAERRKLVSDYTPKDPRQFMEVPWHCQTEGCSESLCSEHERTPVPHVMCGQGVAAHPTPVAALPAIEKRNARWIDHIDNRLAYEKAMLGESGKLDLLEKPKRPKAPPLLNYRAETVRVKQKWGSGVEVCEVRDMTKAQYKKVYHGSRWTVALAPYPLRPHGRALRAEPMARCDLLD
jgi:hypothetical protein